MSDEPTPAPTPAPRHRPKARQEKPWPKFPLFWHQRGYWAVKRDGRQIPYGPDWQRAYDDFRRDEDARREGKPAPSELAKPYNFGDAINLYYTRKSDQLDESDIAPRQFLRCREYLEDVVKVVPKTIRLSEFSGPQAGELFGKIRRAFLARGLYVCRDAVGVIRACLDYAARKRIMAPADYGEDFDKPTAKQFRQSRQEEAAEHGERAWALEELRRILADAEAHGPPIHAFVLLGLNCAFGAKDLADLREGMIDRKGPAVRFPRPKTGVPRVCPLWGRTLKAIDAARSVRPGPLDPADANRVFLTKTGRPYVHVTTRSDEKGISGFSRVDAVSLMFRRCLVRAGARRHGAGFYTLRAMCRGLLIDANADDALVSAIMGHEYGNPLNQNYVRGDLMERLRKVVNHVENQLFPPLKPASSRSSSRPRRGRA